MEHVLIETLSNMNSRIAVCATRAGDAWQRDDVNRFQSATLLVLQIVWRGRWLASVPELAGARYLAELFRHSETNSVSHLTRGKLDSRNELV